MSVSATSWLAPELFKKEFQKYKEIYLENNSDADLVMSYILLQLFIENHFHYYLRFMIGGGFKSGVIATGWKEMDYPDGKLVCLEVFLKKNNFVFTSALLAKIKDNYKRITNIRNALAHGHEVTTTFDSVKKDSKAKGFLNRQKFNQTCLLANEIADAWNALLIELQEQKELLESSGSPTPHFLDYCKIKVF